MTQKRTSLKRSLASETARLIQDRRGATMVMWALTGAALLGLTGVAMDFARAEAVKVRMQNAADAAAMVAERNAQAPFSVRLAQARAYFDQNLKDLPFTSDVHFKLVDLKPGHRVEATLAMKTFLSRIVEDKDLTIGVAAEAQAGTADTVEVALVLDNTGSMRNSMDALRDGANDLSTILFDTGAPVSIGVVPFVGAVNIGNDASHMAWMDTAGDNPTHGAMLENRVLGKLTSAACNPPPPPPPPPGPPRPPSPPPPPGPPRPPSPPPPPPPPPPSGGGDRVDSGDDMNGGARPDLFAAVSHWFAHAWGGSPASAFGASPYTHVVVGGGCQIANPAKINHFTLFAQIPNTRWKGCVEARPAPYDVTDEAPGGNPMTRFVPYFWLDDRDNLSTAYNNYLPDGPFYPGSTQASDAWGRTASVFKYAGVNASIDDTPPSTRGPNQSCPTPILPLTRGRAAVRASIDAMRHWDGSGTNSEEGLMWGWRVLSPGEPFTEGAPYGEHNRKIVVLMSDGKNAAVPNPNDFIKSDYAAYNYLNLWANGGFRNGVPASGRLSIGDFIQYQNFIDGRMRQACANARQAGVEIYTVLFNEPDAPTRALFRQCATDVDHAFIADDTAELRTTFRAIAGSIGHLRLTK